MLHVRKIVLLLCVLLSEKINSQIPYYKRTEYNISFDKRKRDEYPLKFNRLKRHKVRTEYRIYSKNNLLLEQCEYGRRWCKSGIEIDQSGDTLIAQYMGYDYKKTAQITYYKYDSLRNNIYELRIEYRSNNLGIDTCMTYREYDSLRNEIKVCVIENSYDHKSLDTTILLSLYDHHNKLLKEKKIRQKDTSISNYSPDKIYSYDSTGKLIDKKVLSNGILEYRIEYRNDFGYKTELHFNEKNQLDEIHELYGTDDRPREDFSKSINRYFEQRSIYKYKHRYSSLLKKIQHYQYMHLWTGYKRQLSGYTKFRYKFY